MLRRVWPRTIVPALRRGSILAMNATEFAANIDRTECRVLCKRQLNANTLLLPEWARLLFVGCQTYADKLFVVSGKNVFVGKRRMRPAYAATLAELIESWLKQMCPADFFVALG
jgi:hypothetical protein